MNVWVSALKFRWRSALREEGRKKVDQINRMRRSATFALFALHSTWVGHWCNFLVSVVYRAQAVGGWGLGEGAPALHSDGSELKFQLWCLPVRQPWTVWVTSVSTLSKCLVNHSSGCCQDCRCGLIARKEGDVMRWYDLGRGFCCFHGPPTVWL